MSDTRLENIRTRLEALLAGHPGLMSLLIATADGHCVQAVGCDPARRSRLAAMTSSLLALAEQLSEAEGTGRCRLLMIEGEDGVAVLRRVSRQAVLVLTATHETNLGFAAHAARQAERVVLSSLQGS